MISPGQGYRTQNYWRATFLRKKKKKTFASRNLQESPKNKLNLLKISKKFSKFIRISVLNMLAGYAVESIKLVIKQFNTCSYLLLSSIV